MRKSARKRLCDHEEYLQAGRIISVPRGARRGRRGVRVRGMLLVGRQERAQQSCEKRV